MGITLSNTTAHLNVVCKPNNTTTYPNINLERRSGIDRLKL